MYPAMTFMRLRRCCVCLAFGCFAILLTLMSSPAYAKSVSPSSSTLQCTATSIALHGTQPATITSGAMACMKSTPLHPLSVVESSICGTQQLDLVDNNGNYYCFYGTGYLGYRVNNVVQYNNYDYPAWVRIYPNGSTNGCFFNMSTFSSGSHTSLFNGAHSITQVDINGTQSSNRC